MKKPSRSVLRRLDERHSLCILCGNIKLKRSKKCRKCYYTGCGHRRIETPDYIRNPIIKLKGGKESTKF